MSAARRTCRAEKAKIDRSENILLDIMWYEAVHSYERLSYKCVQITSFSEPGQRLHVCKFKNSIQCESDPHFILDSFPEKNKREANLNVLHCETFYQFKAGAAFAHRNCISDVEVSIVSLIKSQVIHQTWIIGSVQHLLQAVSSE